MKLMPLCYLAACLAVPVAHADSPLKGLQFEQNKQQVMKDIRKVCTPKASMSDTDFANKILSSEENKRHVRDATLALERNNPKNYQDALARVQCPDM
ncbi:YicS family protein [Yokenella regensburgei]|jgi:hypothetical protein|uniref:Uncharacterized protein YicS n=1 Tax=Yokenella regensburgei TaxID=158877 RepID=A0AB38FY45_9ENTR|nr:YicS family protein [Yokenella regensburgei]EHM50119.1 hypothetical protein HMPREF0880_01319 [Yokenella regensburgei ATCC 43003]KFD24465.1 putative secreted protein [Yokenella regensburgei ATCC 49455]SQA64207.1 Uncharacterised protein [Yokenella regensburgei]SQB01805.1 Uncharacterised protein [Yokenella regensburgei]SUQ03194.1 Uncharacterised protein [Yokenella regensburgei]